MQIFKEKQALSKHLQMYKKEGRSVGFVPTMGALHQGHLSLVQEAVTSCDRVVVSIFVNPTQFNNPRDLEKYPRTFDNDIRLLTDISKELIIFSPEPTEIYGNQVAPEHFSFDGLENEMEGKYRKGHFDGVATVIKCLFEVVQPDKAFFGEKDFQQLQIIRKLADKLQWKIEIIGCPIARESSGLARSSRNERLSPEERQNAAFIYDALQQVKQEFGIKNASEIISEIEKRFRKNPALKLEYFEIADEATLKTIQEKEEGAKYRAFIAAYSGEIRLIDNISLN